jgi:hypothetical protein
VVVLLILLMIPEPRIPPPLFILLRILNKNVFCNDCLIASSICYAEFLLMSITSFRIDQAQATVFSLAAPSDVGTCSAENDPVLKLSVPACAGMMVDKVIGVTIELNVSFLRCKWIPRPHTRCASRYHYAQWYALLNGVCTIFPSRFLETKTTKIENEPRSLRQGTLVRPRHRVWSAGERAYSEGVNGDQISA